MAEKRPHLRRAGMIAIAVCAGALFVLPSATAVGQTVNPCPGRPVGAPVHPPTDRGNPPADHGKPPQADADSSSASAPPTKRESPGRHLALGHETNPTPTPPPESPGRHLALGHETNPTQPPPECHGRHLAPGQDGPASNGHHRLPAVPAPKRTDRHTGHDTTHSRGGDAARHPGRPTAPPAQVALPFRNVVHTTHPRHHQPNRVTPDKAHHAATRPATKPTPPQHQSIGPMFQELLRPGSPAMVLSLIVVMCGVGTGVVVLMARRKPPKPTS